MTAQNLDFSKTENESMRILASSVQQFCLSALQSRRLRTLRETGTNFDCAVWQEMVAAGWTGIALSDDDGGLGLAPDAFVCTNYEMGRVVAAEPIFESATVCATLLAAASNASYYVTKLVEQGVVFTSPLACSPKELLNICSAERIGEEFQLNGCFEQVSNFQQADYFVVPALLDSALNVFVVPCQAAGINVAPIKLADLTFDARVTLNNVKCSETDRIIFEDPDVAINRAMMASALGASAYLLGLSDALLEQTLLYLRQREQFGRPIGSFQSLQHRSVDWYLQSRLCAAAIKESMIAFSEGNYSSALVDRMLTRAREAARLAAREAIQMHGAIGYTLEHDLALYTQRALVMAARFSQTDNGAEHFDSCALSSNDSSQTVLASRLLADFQPDEDDWNSLDDESFRLMLRQWIAENYPEELRHYPGQVRWAAIKDWHQALVERGWVAPAWPREHGGMALDPNKLLIYVDEMERHGVARAPDQGIVMVGPVLMSYGNDLQRERYLAPSLRGDYIWCQGYSEPNAGSDLASLNTRAELIGDEFIVNGHKIWTTHGLDATHMYCLVRTNSEVKPQAGISFLLIDLDQQGIDVRPIPNLSGDVDFCEVFLSDVRVPVADLVGELNNGWTIAKALLGHERLFVGSPKLCRHALSQLYDFAKAKGIITEPVFADKFRQITRDVFDLEALYTEFAEQIKRGETPGADVAILKIGATETYTSLSEMMLAAAGTAGAVHGKVSIEDKQFDVLSHYYNARPAPIYAGSNEIQRNIIAKQVLGLPT